VVGRCGGGYVRVRGWGPECEGDGEGKGVRVRGR
jgi:hypothetical protein